MLQEQFHEMMQLIYDKNEQLMSSHFVEINTKANQEIR